MTEVHLENRTHAEYLEWVAEDREMQ
ncbi:unnamed protein product, partial [Rotaria sp. Silwood2]